MAKKPTPKLNVQQAADLYSPTTQAEELKAGIISVKLSGEELHTLDGIAAELHTSRSKLIRYAIGQFVERYQAGEMPPTKTVTVADI